MTQQVESSPEEQYDHDWEDTDEELDTIVDNTATSFSITAQDIKSSHNDHNIISDDSAWITSDEDVGIASDSGDIQFIGGNAQVRVDVHSSSSVRVGTISHAPPEKRLAISPSSASHSQRGAMTFAGIAISVLEQIDTLPAFKQMFTGSRDLDEAISALKIQGVDELHEVMDDGHFPTARWLRKIDNSHFDSPISKLWTVHAILLSRTTESGHDETASYIDSASDVAGGFERRFTELGSLEKLHQSSPRSLDLHTLDHLPDDLAFAVTQVCWHTTGVHVLIAFGIPTINEFVMARLLLALWENVCRVAFQTLSLPTTTTELSLWPNIEWHGEWHGLNASLSTATPGPALDFLECSVAVLQSHYDRTYSPERPDNSFKCQWCPMRYESQQDLDQAHSFCVTQTRRLDQSSSTSMPAKKTGGNAVSYDCPLCVRSTVAWKSFQSYVESCRQRAITGEKLRFAPRSNAPDPRTITITREAFRTYR